MGMTIDTDPRCESCKKDWTKCGTCPVMMQWVKEMREKNESNRRRQITETV